MNQLGVGQNSAGIALGRQRAVERLVYAILVLAGYQAWGLFGPPGAGTLVARRQTLEFQHLVARLPCRPVGHQGISGRLDADRRRLARRGSLAGRSSSRARGRRCSRLARPCLEFGPFWLGIEKGVSNG